MQFVVLWLVTSAMTSARLRWCCGVPYEATKQWMDWSSHCWWKKGAVIKCFPNAPHAKALGHAETYRDWENNAKKLSKESVQWPAVWKLGKRTRLKDQKGGCGGLHKKTPPSDWRWQLQWQIKYCKKKKICEGGSRPIGHEGPGSAECKVQFLMRTRRTAERS